MIDCGELGDPIILVVKLSGGAVDKGDVGVVETMCLFSGRYTDLNTVDVLSCMHIRRVHVSAAEKPSEAILTAKTVDADQK